MEAQDYRPAKNKATLKNGRCRKPPARFVDLWAKVPLADVCHPAWRYLTASAKDVMIVCIVKSSYSASKGMKDVTGRPKFQFTYTEAEKLLGMTSPTFDRVMEELKTRGYIGVIDAGGILCGKGRPAQYHLTDKWKAWQPPPRNTANMTKARAARKRSKPQADAD